jgi:dihydropteroate synthase
MGVVNVTPDSFSDGGRWLDPAAAVAHGRTLVSEGAGIVDVGGESTRPGATPVGTGEELRRVIPVVEGLAGAGAVVSIDTMKLEVARASVSAGAAYVNDVSAFRGDPGMAAFVAEAGCGCCLMHMLGEPGTMQDDPRYDDVVDEVKSFLSERVAFAIAEGVSESQIQIDPGIGFGKTVEHNLSLLARLDEIVALGFPVVVGASRKSFLARLIGTQEPQRRLAPTIAANLLAFERGARVFRVHDVQATHDALLLAATLRANG